MENKNIIIAGIILVMIIIGMFVFTYLKKSEMNQAENTPITKTDTNVPYGDITRIDAKHFFQNGTHTIVGEMQMPTPCDLLNWSTRILEGKPQLAIVDFTVVNHTDSCALVVTTQRFKVSFDAEEHADIQATLEQRKIDVNLIPAKDGETPDDYELFLKG